MPPSFSTSDLDNRSVTHSKTVSQLVQLYSLVAKFPDLASLLRCQLGRASIGSTSLTTFRNHIFIVVRFGSKKEMIRIDTSGGIALVEYTHSLGYLSKPCFPRRSMGEHKPISASPTLKIPVPL